MKSFLAIISSSRPISWINTAFPFAVAYLLITREFDLNFWVGTLFFLIPYNLLMYGINDVFDYESDLANPRKGGVEGALLAPELHRPTIITAVSLSAPFLIYLFWVGDFSSGLILAITIFAVIAYSLKGLRFKEIPFLDSITSASHFTGPMLFGISLAGANIFENPALLIVFSLFFWSMASHAFGAVQDVKADRNARIGSVATSIGARWTVRFSFVLYALAALLVVLAGGRIALAAIALIPYLGILIPYWNLKDEDCEKANWGWRSFLWLNIFAGAVVSLIIIEIVQGR
ncbi:MAG: prenyltransferase [Microbacteriaceae bacterium]|nr:prenyltransferase [Microbacteriaceae bacterium]MDR9443851.1 prenyltransferase [Microbacteriaceae bacterium]